MNILVVEDDRAAATELVENLRLMGHAAEWTGGQTPLVVRASCDLVLLDLGLGMSDGFEVLEQIARGHARPSVAIVSGHDARIVESARKLGKARGISIVGTLTKPFSPASFAGLLDRMALPVAPERFAEPIDGAELQPTYVYQAKHGLLTEDIVGYEALLRLPGVGSIENWFVSLDHEQSLAMTVAAAEAALRLRAQLARRHLSTMVSFNCPPDVFGQERFLAIMRRLIARSNVDPATIAIELTEQQGQISPVDLASMASRYILAGFQVHLDDFGAGTASLEQLLGLPLSEVKIDRRLFHSLRYGNQALLAEIVTFCRAHGITSTIEGIETAEDLAIARETGADCGQGFYWGTPAAEVLTLQ